MTTFNIYELQNATSYGAPAKVEVKSLRGAKIIASNMQCFQRTHMKIESENGDVLAIKDDAGIWKNYE